MVGSDVFVGGVAMILGSVVVSAAVFNWEWYYQLNKPRWVEEKWGRGRARVIFALIGSALIVLGGIIAIGLMSNASASKCKTEFIKVARI